MCTCSSIDLLNFGCKCGHIETTNSLWFNGTLYLIAKDQATASALALQEISNLQWLVGDGQGWRKIPDDHILTFGFADKSAFTLTAADWAEFYTPGYLATK